MGFLDFAVAFWWNFKTKVLHPCRTVHCIFCPKTQVKNPGQKSGQRSGQKSGQNLVNFFSILVGAGITYWGVSE